MCVFFLLGNTTTYFVIEKPSVRVEEAAARIQNLRERQKEAVPSCAPHGAIRADFPVRDKHPALKIRVNRAT